jgi:hypothetical protein
MIIEVHKCIEFNDLSVDAQEDIRKTIEEGVRNDSEVFEEIKRVATQEWLELSLEYRKKYTVDDVVRNNIAKIVINNEHKFRGWFFVDMEVDL